MHACSSSLASTSPTLLRSIFPSSTASFLLPLLALLILFLFLLSAAAPLLPSIHRLHGRLVVLLLADGLDQVRRVTHLPLVRGKRRRLRRRRRRELALELIEAATHAGGIVTVIGAGARAGARAGGAAL